LFEILKITTIFTNWFVWLYLKFMPINQLIRCAISPKLVAFYLR